MTTPTTTAEYNQLRLSENNIPNGFCKECGLELDTLGRCATCFFEGDVYESVNEIQDIIFDEADDYFAPDEGYL